MPSLSGVVLPTPVGRCRYWHRSLNPKKLVEVCVALHALLLWWLSPLWLALWASCYLHYFDSLFCDWDYPFGAYAVVLLCLSFPTSFIVYCNRDLTFFEWFDNIYSIIIFDSMMIDPMWNHFIALHPISLSHYMHPFTHNIHVGRSSSPQCQSEVPYRPW